MAAQQRAGLAAGADNAQRLVVTRWPHDEGPIGEQRSARDLRVEDLPTRFAVCAPQPGALSGGRHQQSAVAKRDDLSSLMAAA